MALSGIMTVSRTALAANLMRANEPERSSLLRSSNTARTRKVPVDALI